MNVYNLKMEEMEVYKLYPRHKTVSTQRNIG